MHKFLSKYKKESAFRRSDGPRYLSFMIIFGLVSTPTLAQQVHWEDVAADFARSTRKVRTGFGEVYDPYKDRVPAVLREASRFAQAHGSEGAIAVDFLSCAAHSDDEIPSMLAAISLVSLNDQQDADRALLELVQDRSRSFSTFALSYTPINRARSLLARAVRAGATSYAVIRLLGVVGNSEDLKILRAEERKENTNGPTTKAGPLHFGGGRGFGGIDPSTTLRNAVNMLEYRLNLPEAERPDWQRQEILYFQTESLSPGFESTELTFLVMARWARERGATFTPEFLRHKLAGPDQPDASLAAALAGEAMAKALIPDLKRLASGPAGVSAEIAKIALARLEGPASRP